MQTPDFHRLCREALAGELRSFCTGGFEVTARPGASFPLSTNAAFLLSPDQPHSAAQTIAAHRFQCELFGVRMIEAAHASPKGYVNFSFTGGFYDALMNEAVKTPLVLPKLHDTPTTAEYALQRMRMIQRVYGRAPTCPQDSEARAALWAALAIPGALTHKKRLSLRLEHAAKLLLAAPLCAAPRLRRERLWALSGVAAAGARMLALGLNELRKGDGTV